MNDKSTSSTSSSKVSSRDNNYFYKLFRVKRKDGKITTVSMDPILVARACRIIPGGLKEVGTFVRKTALEFDPEISKNCSGFVSKRLTKLVEEVRPA